MGEIIVSKEESCSKIDVSKKECVLFLQLGKEEHVSDTPTQIEKAECKRIIMESDANISYIEDKIMNMLRLDPNFPDIEKIKIFMF